MLCYMKLLMFAGLFTMFMGGATEWCEERACIMPGMTERQVVMILGEPVGGKGAGELQTAPPPVPRCTWTYKSPYRLITFEDGRVVAIYD